MKMGDAELRRHLRQLEWSIWKTRAANFRLHRKAYKWLIVLIIAYPLSFGFVFHLFSLNIPPEPWRSDAWIYWSYPATTKDCEGEAGLDKNLTNACVVGPPCNFYEPVVCLGNCQYYYTGNEWPFRFYAPFVRYYKYLRRNDFKGEYQ